jgi:serine phosphatase RsbU (regulator of sigma subunit)
MRYSFKSRIALAFYLAAILLSGYFFLFMHTAAARDLTERLRSFLKTAAVIGAGFMDGDAIRALPATPSCETMPYYEELVRSLKRIKLASDKIHDAYVLIPSGKSDTLLFVANANRETEPVRCGEPYDIRDLPELAEGLTRPSADRKPERDKWGLWLSGYAPVLDASGKSAGVLGLDMAAETIADLKRLFVERYILMMMVALVIALLLGFVSSAWLSRPLDEIITGMERVGDGDLGYTLKTFPQVEFEKMSRIFNAMVASLKHSMRELAETVTERERINRELEIAADLNRKAMVDVPPEMPGLQVAASNVPAKEVGGDYYDVLPIDANRTGLLIADAAGKGFHSTLLMTHTRSVFRVLAQDSHTPASILGKTNDFLCREQPGLKGLFITFFYAIYDAESRKLTYANAGHHLPLLISGSDGSTRSLAAQNLPLSILENQRYEEGSVALDRGDIVLLYTDGVIEASNTARDMFGLNRLAKIVEGARAEHPHVILDQIAASVRAFAGSAPQFDDMTLLVLKAR